MEVYASFTAAGTSPKLMRFGGRGRSGCSVKRSSERRTNTTNPEGPIVLGMPLFGSRHYA
jgi:hypothetical protein